MHSIFLYIYARPLIQIVFAIVISVIVWTLVALLLERFGRFKVLCYSSRVLLAVLMFVILYMTTLSRSQNDHPIQLIPFYSLIEAKTQPEFYREMLMNVFLFVPLGLTMPYALPDKVIHKVRTTFFITCGFSTLIELTQMLFHLGRCETDDILMNTLGAVIGTLSFYIFEKIKKKNHKNA